MPFNPIGAAANIVVDGLRIVTLEAFFKSPSTSGNEMSHDLSVGCSLRNVECMHGSVEWEDPIWRQICLFASCL
jgi:hypothetical protein